MTRQQQQQQSRRHASRRAPDGRCPLGHLSTGCMLPRNGGERKDDVTLAARDLRTWAGGAGRASRPHLGPHRTCDVCVPRRWSCVFFSRRDICYLFSRVKDRSLSRTGDTLTPGHTSETHTTLSNLIREQPPHKHTRVAPRHYKRRGARCTHRYRTAHTHTHLSLTSARNARSSSPAPW